MSVKDKSVLLTGASQGLGLALFGELARAGARVVGVARNAAAIEHAAAELRGLGLAAHGLAADVGQKSDVYPIAGAAAALVGPIDILIHNASSLGPTPLRLLLDSTCEDFSRVLEVNLLGLNFGVDPKSLSIKLPIVGRLGPARDNTPMHVELREP